MDIGGSKAKAINASKDLATATSAYGAHQKEAEEQLQALEKKYGKAPDDLEWGFVKD